VSQGRPKPSRRLRTGGANRLLSFAFGQIFFCQADPCLSHFEQQGFISRIAHLPRQPQTIHRLFLIFFELRHGPYSTPDRCAQPSTPQKLKGAAEAAPVPYSQGAVTAAEAAASVARHVFDRRSPALLGEAPEKSGGLVITHEENALER
jgi:hypothetical protein